MHYLYLILLAFILFSCNSNNNNEDEKTMLRTASALCIVESNELSRVFEQCKNSEEFDNKMPSFTCSILNDKNLKTKKELEYTSLCVNNLSNLTCEELNNITKLSDVESCYLYDKPENYRTKKEVCIETYHYFCKYLNHKCSENLTEACKDAKYQNTSPDRDPKEIHFDKEVLENYCDLDDGSEKVTIYDLQCPKQMKSCQDFEDINFDVNQYYTACFIQE